MISDSKKEEIRDAADLVEVVSDYVKLKKSGSSYKGLCPFHDEKTPSFHVTPRLRIYKCFGCGASGDVFNFIMEMEGVGFTEALRSLAERYQISLPEQDTQEYDEAQYLREGIYHALRFAGVYYHNRLKESDEAKRARSYLKERGYKQKTIRRFGLGYAPSKGEALYEAASDTGINEEYLEEAGLIKPSKRGEGFYDTFRGRLMFPIFNPSGKVIAFAGRVLGDKDTAKYINSPNTEVYNKSEVVYAVNFAKHAIRRNDEAILVEGYTDVLTLHQEGVEQAVATSGTSLTPGQMKTIHRFGDRITMVYDSDTAGQQAMSRGINIALAEGMDVRLMSLPEGDDPDSFVRQFGAESFQEQKRQKAEDFVAYMVHRAQEDGRWEDPMEKKKVVHNILDSIAEIPDAMTRETFVQHLNKFAKDFYDRTLYNELKKKLQEKKKRRKREVKRQQREKQREERRRSDRSESKTAASSPEKKKKKPVQQGKLPEYEKEIIRLMLMYGHEMVEYIGSFCNGDHFEHEQLGKFYEDIIQRHREDKSIDVETYAEADHPFPELVGEIVLERHSVSDRHEEKTGLSFKRDHNPYQTAKGALKALKIHYLDRTHEQLSRQQIGADEEEKQEIADMLKEVGRQRALIQKSSLHELFPDPDSDKEQPYTEKVFEYKPKKPLD